MSQSLRTLLAICVASGSIFVVSSFPAQAIPESDKILEQSSNSLHSVLATEETNSPQASDRGTVALSDATSNTADAIATPEENIENANPRIPIASRIFPSMQQ